MYYIYNTYISSVPPLREEPIGMVFTLNIRRQTNVIKVQSLTQ